MSYTTVYGVPVEGSLIELEDIPNSWGSAMRIWNALMEKYLIPKDISENERLSRIGRIWGQEEGKSIWALSKDNRLSDSERIVLCSTFDKVLYEKDCLDKLADAYLEFNENHPTQGANHLPRLAELFRNAATNQDLVGVCVDQTSVASVWAIHYEADIDDYFLYEHPIDEHQVSWLFKDLLEPLTENT